MKTEIVIKNLSKSYGKKQALRGVDLQIEKGMFGLLGRNGAGKTTLMKVLATLLEKDSGKVKICGIPVEHALEIRKITGYLPQEFSMYPNMSVYDCPDLISQRERRGYRCCWSGSIYGKIPVQKCALCQAV